MRMTVLALMVACRGDGEPPGSEGTSGASCPGPEDRPAFQPDDPFRPGVDPSLACCTWRLGGSTDTHDASGRLVERRAEYLDEDGEVVLTSESWFTWDGLCIVREEATTEQVIRESDVTYVTTVSAETTCDEHDNPVRTHGESTTVQVLPGGTTQPSSWWESTTRFGNTYDGGRLVRTEYLSEDGSPQDFARHYEWAGDLLVNERSVELLGEETADIVGEVGEDGQLTSERAFTWDGARLTGIDASDEFPAWHRVATRYLYEGDRWMGTERDDRPQPDGQTTSSRTSWVYDDEGHFPVALIGTDGDSHDIEVTCE